MMQRYATETRAEPIQCIHFDTVPESVNCGLLFCVFRKTILSILVDACLRWEGLLLGSICDTAKRDEVRGGWERAGEYSVE